MKRKEDWSAVEGIILDSVAYDIIKSEKSLLVTAGPGAGKTEILAQKSSFIFETTRKETRILAISFKRDAAVNLKDRVLLRCGLKYEDSFDSYTYDAFAKQILDQYYRILPDDNRPDINYIIEDGVGDIIKQFSIDSYNRSDWITLKNIRKKLDSTRISMLNQPGLKLWDELLTSKPSRLTFSMITILVLRMISSSPIIRNIISSSYDYVFLDEFQDTTTLQYELVRNIFKDSDITLIAVGDEKQRIMLWAGADNQAFTKFTSDFQAERKELMFNFRSAPKLIEFQLEVYNILNVNKISIGHNPLYKEDEGYISLYEFDDNNFESICISNEIIEKIKSGTNPKDICILTKQLPIEYTGNIIKLLGEECIYARIENEYQDLLKEPIVKLIISLLDLVEGNTNPNSWLIISNYFDKIHISGFKIENMIELDKNIRNISSSKMNFNSKEDLVELIDTLVALLDVNKIKMVFTEYSQGNYLMDIIKKFSELYCREYIRLNTSKIHLINEAFLGEHSIPIMTIHKSKGLEFTHVFFLGLEDSAFWNYSNNPMEDKSTFFVALSRAKKEISFTYCSKRLNFKPPLKRFNCINQSHRNISEIYDLVLQHKMN
ncbi:ATP-dependent DNA helicase PcrA [Candidatus Izimaplasma bacterium HR1]|jgi:superfamily I DNA/RNA helicase|uniref:UvrD-helicase domain-containing protein n=1 Tax=Candidatus Izimoplasma sp. HR1 TaxID=1541959 RepID=UPI0004F6BE72|nr:ATP-dependent DNA helicase PcrA [Candidatus Izimaplasma bacterium HR1]